MDVENTLEHILHIDTRVCFTLKNGKYEAQHSLTDC